MKNYQVVKWIGNVVFIALFGFVTFFGIGPVLIADGSFQERMLTLAVVILIFIALIIGIIFWNRYWNKKQKQG